MLIGRTTELFPLHGSFTLNPTTNNSDHMDATTKWLDEPLSGSNALCFANFEDFDMLYGHRNDPHGFANALEVVDAWVGNELIPRLGLQDIVILTADHGNDPTTPGTDHSREFAPLLCFGPGLKRFGDVGILPSFACVGYTIAKLFDLPSASDRCGFLD
jgi:phosphopentomutase